MKITRDVVSDLWPVYEAGEASRDTRALVESFLAEDPAFATTLRGGLRLPPVEVTMTQASQAQALKRTRDLVHGRGWLRGVRLFALVMTVFAFKHLLQDVAWTAPPTRFIAESLTAGLAWVVYASVLTHQRQKALRS